QFDAVALLDRRRARLGELAGNASDLHHRQRGGIGEHDRHLQEHAEEVADIVGAVLGEALRAIAALQQESLPLGHARERLFQVAGLACKNERRKGRKLLLDVGQSLRVRIVRHLLDRLLAPAIGAPTLGHRDYSRNWRALYTRAAGQCHRSGFDIILLARQSNKRTCGPETLNLRVFPDSGLAPSERAEMTESNPTPPPGGYRSRPSRAW